MTTQTPDPVLDPLVATMQRALVRHMIGRRLGECPVTRQHTLDVRESLQVWTADPRGNRDADLIMVVSREGLAGLDADKVRTAGYVVVDARQNPVAL